MPSPEDLDPPTGEEWRQEIALARERIEARLPPTPLVRSQYLERKLGRPVFLKLESQQPVGAFKVRPALNSILAQLSRCRSSGVVTNSSGNFAQAVAWTATELGVDAQVVMMRGASEFKRSRTRDFGATVVLCDDTYAARFGTTERIRKETGRSLVHPFDSVESIAGNATLGEELLAQLSGDFTLYVPVSGGGLIAGCALAVRTARPDCAVYGVQAAANPATRLSLDQGRRVRSTPRPSLADALTVPRPGALTFAVIRRLVEQVVLVSEQEMVSAIRSLALEQKLVAEAGGAVSVAAALRRPPPGHGPIVCVISGGNIDPARLAAIVADEGQADRPKGP